MLIKESVFFSPTRKMRNLHIYLPPDYQTSGRSYPVMYFFDGHNLFEDRSATYGKCWVYFTRISPTMPTLGFFRFSRIGNLSNASTIPRQTPE